MSESMIAVKEVYLNQDEKTGNMVVLKEHVSAPRYFQMFVGDSEFAAIAKAKGMIQSPRPLTYEVYLEILEYASLDFLRVEIYGMQNNTYHARVVFQAGGIEHAVESRPSDAVALGLSRKIPIWVGSELFHRELTGRDIGAYQEIVKTVRF